MNQELTCIHQEIILNLEAIHGALLRMNHSIQAEGTFGVLKWNKSYKRLFRRGEKSVILELTLISCGFNRYKYHNKSSEKSWLLKTKTLSTWLYLVYTCLLRESTFIQILNHKFKNRQNRQMLGLAILD